MLKTPYRNSVWPDSMTKNSGDILTTKIHDLGATFCPDFGVDCPNGYVEPGEKCKTCFIQKHGETFTQITPKPPAPQLYIKHVAGGGWGVSLPDASDGVVITSLGPVNAEKIANRFKVDKKIVEKLFYEAALNIASPGPLTPENDEATAVLIEVVKSEAELFRDETKVAYVTYEDTKTLKDTRDTSTPIVLVGTKEGYIPPQETSNKDGVSVSSVSSVSIKKTTAVTSQQFRRWLSRRYYRDTGKAPGRDTLNSVILVLEAEADTKPIHKLYNRVAPDGKNGIWVDMCNEGGEAIHITKDGWGVEEAPQIFKHYSHQAPLPQPLEKSDRGLEPILDYFNIEDTGDQLLAVVTPITYFIPNVPHVIHGVHGPQGAIKTTGQVFIRRVIDPSETPYLNLPDDLKELAQVLDHQYMPIFDNLSTLSEAQSDMLCKASTGMGQSQRSLYTNDDDYIRKLRRCVAWNGIVVPINRGDFMDRSVLLEVDEFNDAKRVEDNTINQRIEEDVPIVLGAVLNILVKAMKLYDDPVSKPTRLSRMADFHHWGCAITMALGLDKKFFEKPYMENKKNQDAAVIEGSTIAEWIMRYMVGTNKFSITASSADLKSYIEEYANPLDEHNKPIGDLLSRKEGWPKNSTQFGKELTRIIPAMKTKGYYIKYIKGKDRKYSILREVVPDEKNPEEQSGQTGFRIEIEKLSRDKLISALKSAGVS
jgi:hypothetical protein